jgi:hypothetical protein
MALLPTGTQARCTVALLTIADGQPSARIIVLP